MKTLTQKNDWDKNYIGPSVVKEMQFGWRYKMNALIAGKIEAMGLEGKKILEIGAGDSQWLPHLAKKYPCSRFAGLDYSEAGCNRLAQRAEKVSGSKSIDIYNQDMFAETEMLRGRFDVVMSFGVVEHFTDLPRVLTTKKYYLKSEGLLFTVIPNMAGSIGYLTKKHDRAVYDMHNPHDWPSFRDGHRAAGLDIIAGGYLGSINYGVLSSCFKKGDGVAWYVYLLLSKLSLLAWLTESRFGDLPVSRTFSPYIYAVSRAA